MNKNNESADNISAQMSIERPAWIEDYHPEAKSVTEAAAEEIAALYESLIFHAGIEWKVDNNGVGVITITVPAQGMFQ